MAKLLFDRRLARLGFTSRFCTGHRICRTHHGLDKFEVGAGNFFGVGDDGTAVDEQQFSEIGQRCAATALATGLRQHDGFFECAVQLIDQRPRLPVRHVHGSPCRRNGPVLVDVLQ